MNDLIKLQNKIKNNTVLVIGDAILDVQINGEFKGKSAEVDIPVFKESGTKFVLGGACNVAVNLLEAGQTVKFCYAVKNDNYNDKLNDLLLGYKNTYGEKLSICGVLTSGVTTVKKRYFVGDTQIFRSDEELPSNLSKGEEIAFIDCLKTQIPSCNIVVISDYNKGVITTSLVEKIVKIAKESGVKVIADPKTNDYTKYKNCNYIKPNLKEFTEMVKFYGTGGVNEKTASEIANKNGNDAIIVTLGADGMFFALANGDRYNQKGVKTQVVDVCGAGDTALSYLAVGLTSELTPNECMILANTASSKKLQKLGASGVSVNELFVPLTKIISSNEIPYVLKALQGKKIVFTNGCFDILHKGHIKSLKKAKELGDALIVGVNTDDSIKRLKAENRPYNNLESRLEVLSALPFINYIIPFSEDTPYELIKAIKPSVLVKGSEYKNTGIVGEDIVKSNGGEVVYIEMERGYSTTATLNKIYANNK